MTIESPAFVDNGAIPARYTCDGDNRSPPLRMSGIPVEAQSIALVVDDPDAPGGTFTHWTVWNMAPSVTGIAEGSVPTGAVQGMTSARKQGYGGPCPPSGEHRYFFRLYALSEMLNLASTAGVSQLRSAMQGSVLAEAELMGRYARSSSSR